MAHVNVSWKTKSAREIWNKDDISTSLKRTDFVETFYHKLRCRPRPRLFKLVCCKNLKYKNKKDISRKSTGRTYLLRNLNDRAAWSWICWHKRLRFRAEALLFVLCHIWNTYHICLSFNTAEPVNIAKSNFYTSIQSNTNPRVQTILYFITQPEPKYNLQLVKTIAFKRIFSAKYFPLTSFSMPPWFPRNSYTQCQ